ncbi:unnamed protein product [Blepharisma stoltei]|uniref:RRM domain-containing protein n=1 Tax=Blepharisma stoltei TaxID=1481888 RepID=A0AAU9J808_9CILI|nr:unnamed protein product [Blepharisma stoltei]
MEESKAANNENDKTSSEDQEEAEDLDQKQSETDEIDNRSIFVGNVDFSASTEELRDVFKECGNIERVTIPLDKWTHHPKGYAYIEFSDRSSVLKAQSVNEKSFKGRKLKVLPKRTNIPGQSRSRFPRSRARMRGAYAYGRPRYSRFKPY